jgi:hypothetical protein
MPQSALHGKSIGRLVSVQILQQNHDQQEPSVIHPKNKAERNISAFS